MRGVEHYHHQRSRNPHSCRLRSGFILSTFLTFLVVIYTVYDGNSRRQPSSSFEAVNDLAVESTFVSSFASFTKPATAAVVTSISTKEEQVAEEDLVESDLPSPPDSWLTTPERRTVVSDDDDDDDDHNQILQQANTISTFSSSYLSSEHYRRPPTPSQTDDFPHKTNISSTIDKESNLMVSSTNNTEVDITRYIKTKPSSLNKLLESSVNEVGQSSTLAEETPSTTTVENKILQTTVGAADSGDIGAGPSKKEELNADSMFSNDGFNSSLTAIDKGLPPIPSFQYALDHNLSAVLRSAVYIKLNKANTSNYVILDDKAETQLAVCINPKVLSTVFHAVMTHLRYPTECPLTNERNRISEIFLTSAGGTSNNKAINMCSGWNMFQFALRPDQNINNLHETVYLAAIRDPFDRFVSGWLDKCYHHQEICYNCPRKDFACFVRRHYKAMSSLVGTEAFDPSIHPHWYIRTYHWYPQNWICAITDHNPFRNDSNKMDTEETNSSNTISSSHTIKLLTYSRSESLYDQLTSILGLYHHVSIPKLKFIRDSLASVTTRHSTFQDSFKDEINRLVRFNSTVCQLMYLTLKSDYDVFGFERPWCIRPAR